jgi:hypothetical protein
MSWLPTGRYARIKVFRQRPARTLSCAKWVGLVVVRPSQE